MLAAASFGVTELLIKAISHVGGFYSRAIPAGSQISHWSTVPAQVHALAENLLILFGANFWRLPQPQAAFAYLHLVCLALALIGLVVSIVRWRTADRVTRALVIGIFVMLAAGAASPLMIPDGGTHEIAVILPLGAVLGGRVVGSWLAARAGSAGPGDAGLGAAGVLAAAALGLLCCLGYAAAQPAHAAEEHPDRQLAARAPLDQRPERLLEREHHHPPRPGARSTWRRWPTAAPTAISGSAKESWFNPDLSYANFIVTTTKQQGGSDVPLQERPGLVRQARQVLRGRPVHGRGLQPQPARGRHPAGAEPALRAEGRGPRRDEVATAASDRAAQPRRSYPRGGPDRARPAAVLR